MMKKIGISGSWRISALSPGHSVVREVERDVRRAAREIIAAGNGIVSGGAFGVDYWATDEAMQDALDREQVQVIIPTSFNTFFDHLARRRDEGVITAENHDALYEQLSRVRADFRLVTMQHKVCNERTYHDRNTRVVAASDALEFFSVNASPGTADTMAKAKAAGKPARARSYSIPELLK